MRANRAKDVRVNVVPEPQTREAIRLLAETLSLVDVSIDQKTVEFTATAPSGSIDNPLGAVPTDLLLTWNSGSGTFAWDYGKSTKDKIYYTSSQPATIRAIIGRRG